MESFGQGSSGLRIHHFHYGGGIRHSVAWIADRFGREEYHRHGALEPRVISCMFSQTYNCRGASSGSERPAMDRSARHGGDPLSSENACRLLGGFCPRVVGSVLESTGGVIAARWDAGGVRHRQGSG